MATAHLNYYTILCFNKKKIGDDENIKENFMKENTNFYVCPFHKGFIRRYEK